MNKELAIILERFEQEQYQKENLTNEEILVMNYDDCMFDDAEFMKKECEDKNTDIDTEHNVEETFIVNRELKVEDEQLCDIDTKENVLMKFEEAGVDATEKEKSEEDSEFESDKKKFICYLCQFRAKKKHHLSCHILFSHTHKKQAPTSFECQYCMYKTKYKHNLSPHMARFHMDDIQYDGSANTKPKKSCYDTKGTNVTEISSLDKDNVFNCNYCSFATPHKGVIVGHSMIHTLYKTEVLQCNECPKKFTEQAMRRHMNKVHNPEGVFKCPKCPYTAKWKGNLRRHLKQNKDSETCKSVSKRKPRKNMAQDRLKGKASHAGKRKKNDSDSE